MNTKVRKKPVLAVAGFLGRGNAGDEALIQCIYEAFNETFDIVLSVDEHGAYPGWWDWYPYNVCRRIHQGNLNFSDAQYSGMIVGGGGLPIGFVADQVIAARSVGMPVALVGVDHSARPEAPAARLAALSTYLNLFDYVSYRSAESVRRGIALGHNIHYGADWALRLPADESPDVVIDRKQAVVVVREFPLSQVDLDHYGREMRGLIAGLQSAGYSPVFLPFAPEDVRFARDVQIDHLAPTREDWWNPRRMKQIIDASGLMVSIGRLHPMIFAAPGGTPSIQIAPPLRTNYTDTPQKLTIMASEFDIPYVLTVEEAIERLRKSEIVVSEQSRHLVGKSKIRLNDMISDLHKLFGARRLP